MNFSLTPAQKAIYLQTLPAIRERCTRVHKLALEGKLDHFNYHPEKENDVVDYCIGIIQRDFGTNYASIPPHSRWQHFNIERERIVPLVDQWKSSPVPPDQTEIAKRLIDLCLVSVLLDAGAGNEWSYTEKTSGSRYTRSEGLAVASLDAFVEGHFSGEESRPYRVDADGLSRVTVQNAASMFQVSNTNPMSGLEGRSGLLSNLAEALRKSPEFFGNEARPGGLVDFLQTHSKPEGSSRKIHVSALFHALIQGLSPIWPVRHQLAGVSLGDVWPCNALASDGANSKSLSADESQRAALTQGDDFVPFHKLTQWLTYSLVVPLETVLGWKVEGLEDMTGLPEYRNGGLLLDLGVLSLKKESIASFYPDPNVDIPLLPPSHPAVIEWRALTVIELDRIADAIRIKLGEPGLGLPQVLESATWKGGREIAKQKRPLTGGPPINIESDGTVF